MEKHLLNTIKSYLVPGRRVLIVGAGGVSMCALADILHGLGLDVAGSDVQENAGTRYLAKKGVPIAIGHRPETVSGREFLIRTAAVGDANPEVRAARELGLPVFERAQAIGAIMSGYNNVLCVAGTHGKTTATSMAVHIAMAGGADPTALIGGHLPLIGAAHHVGKDDLLIAEACEYTNSFLNFMPTTALILNIEADHLDFFSGLPHIMSSFRQFSELVPENGAVVVNADDRHAMMATQGLSRRLLTFGLSFGADYRAEDLSDKSGFYSFTLTGPDLRVPVSLKTPGLYNVRNALGAAAACHSMGFTGEAIAKGLASFTGTHRRFEYKGEFRGARIFDDYAHHPSELTVLLDAVQGMGFGRTILAFQPHTYSRTKSFFDDFVKQLRRPDLTLLAPIYAARETIRDDISSELLASASGAKVRAFPDLNSIAEALSQLARPGDIILTVGAGNIHEAGEALVGGALAAESTG